MYTLKASSSDARMRSSDLLLDGLRRQRCGAGHRLRSMGGVGVRSQAQASARASSGVRGKVRIAILGSPWLTESARSGSSSWS